MTRLDYECPTCHRTYRDIIRGADEPRPVCYAVGCANAELIIDWSGGGPANNLLRDGGFDFEFDNGAISRVSTVGDIRRIERDTELLHKSGVAQRPIRFRDYSQDHSNRSQNLFGDPPPEARQRPQTRNKRGVPFIGGATRPGKE